MWKFVGGEKASIKGGRRKSTRMDLVMEKKNKGRQKKAPVKEERKKQGYFVLASLLTPNTLVPC